MTLDQGLYINIKVPTYKGGSLWNHIITNSLLQILLEQKLAQGIHKSGDKFTEIGSSIRKILLVSETDGALAQKKTRFFYIRLCHSCMIVVSICIEEILFFWCAVLSVAQDSTE